jgi:ADP-ribose pyrophosphatase YjhB (NUDIX family)
LLKPPPKPLVAAGIIEHDNAVLIVLPDAPDQPRRWQFPRGLANPGESAEAAMRRVAREQLGADVEIVIGQPPLVQTIDEASVEVRYFLCGLIDRDPQGTHYRELRFAPKAQLREYDFDPASAEVVKWLLGA